MFHIPRDVLKARCDSFGLVMRLLFWGFTLIQLFLLGFGVWMMCQPASDFSIIQFDSGSSIMSYTFFRGWEIDFARGILSAGAMDHPRPVYCIGYWIEFLNQGMILAILWNVRTIFRRIDDNESPFTHQSSRAIFTIGVLVLVRSMAIPLLRALALGVAGYWGGTVFPSLGWGLVIAFGIIAVSHIFDYGTSLQTESDETL